MTTALPNPLVATTINVRTTVDDLISKLNTIADLADTYAGLTSLDTPTLVKQIRRLAKVAATAPIAAHPYTDDTVPPTREQAMALVCADIANNAADVAEKALNGRGEDAVRQQALRGLLTLIAGQCTRALGARRDLSWVSA